MTADHTQPAIDDQTWANRLGVSQEAVALHRESEVIDLHVDSFIWTRIFGYDLRAHHGKGLFGDAFYSQVDIPRIMLGSVSGATWVITTNPFLPSGVRRRLFFRNFEKLQGILGEDPERIAICKTEADYRAARKAGKHGAFIGIQGGNCLDHDLADWEKVPHHGVLRVTLVHLSNSTLGTTSSPASGLFSGAPLTAKGKAYIELLNERGIFVDLAHISREGFFDAVDVHDKTKPLIVTHTGVDSAYGHWRNLTDAQLRCVADTGGVIGVMFQSDFLGKAGVSASTIVDHLERIVDVVGEDHAAIGTDYDGAITPPADVSTPEELPRLVQAMLDRGWSGDRIQKILGENFLRSLRDLRG